MNGLELSEKYYIDVIRPMLHKAVPEEVSRIAAGLVGDGSECFGFDDAISRDHDWGAKICLWLSGEDYRRIGGLLTEELSKLPKEFEGYPVCLVPGRNGVLEISAFFRKYLDADGPLQTIGQWLHVPEHHLAAASNGKVFSDPSGKFSAVWNDLRLGYPEDIRIWKLAARCMTMGQAGQYNYPRLARRGDRVAMSLALSEFMQAAISAVYLLNHKYAPFYKWMHFGLKHLPRLGTEIAQKLEELLDETQKEACIEEICEMLITELQQQNLTECQDSFMVAQGESVHAHIQNEKLRKISPWATV